MAKSLLAQISHSSQSVLKIISAKGEKKLTSALPTSQHCVVCIYGAMPEANA